MSPSWSVQLRVMSSISEWISFSEHTVLHPRSTAIYFLGFEINKSNYLIFSDFWKAELAHSDVLTALYPPQLKSLTRGNRFPWSHRHLKYLTCLIPFGILSGRGAKQELVLDLLKYPQSRISIGSWGPDRQTAFFSSNTERQWCVWCKNTDRQPDLHVMWIHLVVSRANECHVFQHLFKLVLVHKPQKFNFREHLAVPISCSWGNIYGKWHFLLTTKSPQYNILSLPWLL